MKRPTLFVSYEDQNLGVFHLPGRRLLDTSDWDPQKERIYMTVATAQRWPGLLSGFPWISFHRTTLQMKYVAATI